MTQLLTVAVTPATAADLAYEPSLTDRAWEALGGGPADLYFPEEFLGVWQVTSTLVNVETPLGTDFVPDMNVVRRAMQDDLNKPLQYNVAFIRNTEGKVIYDRKYNLASLLGLYTDRRSELSEDITWSPTTPNILELSLPGGLFVRTRVTKRSEDALNNNRFSTSEYLQQEIDTSESLAPKVKASQCFTKFKWRSADEAARARGPQIVATQVVTDMLTPYDGEQRYLQAMNKPVVKYVYAMSFSSRAEQ